MLGFFHNLPQFWYIWANIINQNQFLMVKTSLLMVPNLYFIIIYPPKPAGSGAWSEAGSGFFFANKRFFLANKRFFLANKRFFLANKRFFLANKRYPLDRFEPNREPLVRFSGSVGLEDTQASFLLDCLFPPKRSPPLFSKFHKLD